MITNSPDFYFDFWYCALRAGPISHFVTCIFIDSSETSRGAELGDDCELIMSITARMITPAATKICAFNCSPANAHPRKIERADFCRGRSDHSRSYTH